MMKIFYCVMHLLLITWSSLQSFNSSAGVKAHWGELWYEVKEMEVGNEKNEIHQNGYVGAYDDKCSMEEMLMMNLPVKNAHANSRSGHLARTAKDMTVTPAAEITGKLYLRTTFYGSSLSISTIFLSNKGIIVRDAKNGVDPLDLEKEKQENGQNTGSYAITADKMNITWNNGKTASWRVENKNGVMSALDGGIVTLQNKMPAGYKLNGRFAAMGVTNNASSSQTYTFNNDGTFGLKSTGAVYNEEDTRKSTDNKNGRYTISGNTLVLQFNDGKTTRSVICISTIGGKKHLIINKGSYPQE